jgi:hypothetical protein
VTTLYELADVLRSKNAGPFQLTIDVFLPDDDALARAVAPGGLTTARVAALYDLSEADVRVMAVPAIRAVKITMRRPSGSSGSIGDRDVYGAQQHAPLLDLEIA